MLQTSQTRHMKQQDQNLATKQDQKQAHNLDAEPEKMVSEKTVFSKLRGAFSALNREAVYNALLLYYTMRAPETPAWCKSVALGSLAYFISLIDGIPDLTPVLGYTDDITVMAAAIATLSAHITPALKTKARDKQKQLFQDKPPEN